ncbi:hypothetical protein G6514_006582 [Epicoccum nigrum]|nr:hypothetical protein G6514_006582 [Epicoccum nigrum]
MADMTHATLGDLESYAQDRCALGLRILSDTSQYEFEQKVVFQESTRTARQCDVLYVGFYSDRPSTRVYAEFNHSTGQIVYYDGQKDVNISAVSEALKIYPESACLPKDMKHLEPFITVAYLNSARGSRKAPRTVAQEQNRKHLTLLIKFAYLLTGRVGSISHNSPKGWSVREMFVKLCTSVQQRQDEKQRVVKKGAMNPNNNLSGMSGNSVQPTVYFGWPGQPQDSAEDAFSLSIRASKRKIVDLVNCDDDAGSSMQSPQIKRRAELDTPLDTPRAFLHRGAGSNNNTMLDKADETGGVSLTNDMIGSSRALQAGPSSLEERFKTVMELPERHAEPFEQVLRAER